MDIICIHSYKGGAGKTTIALNLSIQLTEQSKRVLLIESDFKMPSLFGIFPEIEPKNYYNDYFNENISLDDCVVSIPKYSNLNLILANPEFNPAEKIHIWDKRFHAFHLNKIKNSLAKIKEKGVYDYVIFDTPPGLSYIAINNIALSSHAIIVVRPNMSAISGSIKMVENLYLKTKSPSEKFKLYLLFNQIPRVKMTKELDLWKLQFESLHVTEVGRIPCSCDGTYEMAKGNNIFSAEHEINRFMLPLLSHLKNEEVLEIPDPTLEF